jgi:hypothetical protein
VRRQTQRTSLHTEPLEPRLLLGAWTPSGKLYFHDDAGGAADVIARSIAGPTRKGDSVKVVVTADGPLLAFAKASGNLKLSGSPLKAEKDLEEGQTATFRLSLKSLDEIYAQIGGVENLDNPTLYGVHISINVTRCFSDKPTQQNVIERDVYRFVTNVDSDTPGWQSDVIPFEYSAFSLSQEKHVYVDGSSRHCPTLTVQSAPTFKQNGNCNGVYVLYTHQTNVSVGGLETGRIVVSRDGEQLGTLSLQGKAGPLPDLIGAGFSYSVDCDGGNRSSAESPKVFNTPLPVNSQFRVHFDVKNSGTGDAPGFQVAFYVSQDSVISAADKRLGAINIAALKAGTTSHLDQAFVLPAEYQRLYGKIWVGAIVDCSGRVLETCESNNLNQKSGLDKRQMQLYDPLPVETLRGGYRSDADSYNVLAGWGFVPVGSAAGHSFGNGYMKPLPVNSWITSPYDGVTRPGTAYRQHAHTLAPNQTYTYYDITVQKWVSVKLTTWTIQMQGNSSLGEPSPEYAWNNDRFSSWCLYVYSWHDHF